LSKKRIKKTSGNLNDLRFFAARRMTFDRIQFARRFPNQ